LTISPSNWAPPAESRVATACRSAGDSQSFRNRLCGHVDPPLEQFVEAMHFVVVEWALHGSTSSPLLRVLRFHGLVERGKDLPQQGLQGPAESHLADQSGRYDNQGRPEGDQGKVVQSRVSKKRKTLLGRAKEKRRGRTCLHSRMPCIGALLILLPRRACRVTRTSRGPAAYRRQENRNDGSWRVRDSGGCTQAVMANRKAARQPCPVGAKIGKNRGSGR